MFVEEPYFMKNEEWYYYDSEESKYKLTDKATPEAIISYEAFYELIDLMPIDDETEEEFEARREKIEDLAYQDELSQTYDEEQQAKQIYGGF